MSNETAKAGRHATPKAIYLTRKRISRELSLKAEVIQLSYFKVQKCAVSKLSSFLSASFEDLPDKHPIFESQNILNAYR